MSKYLLLSAVSVLLLGAGCSTAAPIAPSDDALAPQVDNTKPFDAPPGISGEEINKQATLPSIEVETKAEVSVTPPEVKVINIEGSSFAFAPAEIRVKKGDAVKIVFKSTDGFHDFSVGGYGVATPRITSGGSATVEFVADKIGTFEYYCSVGSHRDLGMTGKLIVE